MAQHVKVTTSTNKMLDKLSGKRKSEESLVRTKQDIAAEAIIYLYKKEMKQDQEGDLS